MLPFSAEEMVEQIGDLLAEFSADPGTQRTTHVYAPEMGDEVVSVELTPMEAFVLESEWYGVDAAILRIRARTNC